MIEEANPTSDAGNVRAATIQKRNPNPLVATVLRMSAPLERNRGTSSDRISV